MIILTFNIEISLKCYESDTPLTSVSTALISLEATVDWKSVVIGARAVVRQREACFHSPLIISLKRLSSIANGSGDFSWLRPCLRFELYQRLSKYTQISFWCTQQLCNLELVNVTTIDHFCINSSERKNYTLYCIYHSFCVSMSGITRFGGCFRKSSSNAYCGMVVPSTRYK